MALSERQLQAARLVFQDKLTNRQIGAECGVSARAVELWKRRQDVRDEIARLAKVWREETLRIDLAEYAREARELMAPDPPARKRSRK